MYYKIMDKMMNILLCIDDFKGDYTRHCAVTILSLLETNKRHKIKIFIMSSCLPKENIEELKRIVKLYNQEIEFIIHDNIVPEEIKSSVINRRNLTWGTWYRLFFPLYIKNVDRLLYMDCDVLVTGDIEDIYNMDMEGKSIAGYHDVSMREYLKKGYFGIENYVNAGVLLFDAKKYDASRINITEIEKVNKLYSKYLNDADQDYINILFQNEIFIYKKCMNYLLDSPYYNFGIKRAIMLHCLQKPYLKYSYCPKYAINLYYKYLNQTKWKNYPQTTDSNLITYILNCLSLFLTATIEKIFGPKGIIYYNKLNVKINIKGN